MANYVRKSINIPSPEEITQERERLEYRKKYIKTLRGTVYSLIVVAAISILLATLFLPVLQISGSSMQPTLNDEDVVVLVNNNKFETGDLIGFYHQNKLLIKRVIGTPGDVIDIDSNGNVYVNGELLDEDYLTDKAYGECDQEFPLQVPENKYFVLGDNRTTSIDSRSTVVGFIEEDQIVGKVVLKIWPIIEFSLIQ